MLTTVRTVNEWFKTATRADVETMLKKILLSERQDKIFEMFYVKRHDIGFIADTLYVSVSVINSELKAIRNKMLKVI